MNLRSLACRAVSLALVATAVAGLDGATSPGGTAAQPTRATTSPTLRLAAATTCADLAVIGVDATGSGWSDDNGPRPAPLRRLTRSLVGQAGAAGNTVSARHLGVAFAPAATLTDPRRPRLRADVSVTKRRARAWRAGVGTATTQVIDELHRRATTCPEQVFALAGADQGAGVVHRVLVRTVADAALQGRVAGAALVSDPDRAAGTRASLLGAPAAWRSGAGVFTRELTPLADVPAAGQDLRVVSVCTRGDLVCDLRGWSAQRALAAHASYADAAVTPVLRDAAARLWDRASAWPRVVAADPVSTHPLAPLDLQLGVRVGVPYAGGVVFDGVEGLPPGVSLGPDGHLTGSVQSAGSWTVTYRVHNTSPATSSALGTLSIVSTSTGAFSAVDGGGQTTCQVDGGGTAACAGDNSSGQLGVGTTTDSTSPVQVGATGAWVQMSTSGLTTCGVKRSGALMCWGANNRGQLGLGGGGQRVWPQPVGAATDWKQVSAGWLHTCAVRTSGALYCWGENSDGQLGLGDRTSHDAPVRVGTASDWASVTTGGWHTCATRTDGSAWCWGRGDLGQLGTGTIGRRLAPTRVASSARWSSLGATWSSSCGVTTDGQLQCWGVNGRGQLGDGTRTTRLAPVGVAGSHTWTDVAVGDEHTCGLDTAGAAWCWGANDYGQLGDGSVVDSLAPVRVAGGGTWAALDAGWLHTCGLALDDTVQCWGNNEHGQLGRGDRADRTTAPGVHVVSPRVARSVVDPGRVVVTTFNILGSQHTVPGGGAKTYAPGRIRSEWATSLLTSLDSGIVGFQEIQPDQYLQLRRSLGSRFAWYPGTTTDPRKVWQSITWDTAQWSLVDTQDLYVPYLGSKRPNLMVRLRNVQSGREIWVLNAHNNAGSTADRQRQRDEAVKIELDAVLTQRQQQVPVVFLGDMNERERVFCTTTRRTDLEAVTGGSYVDGTCTPPRTMHVDWIFASPELATQRAGFVDNAQVDRITDHSLLTSTLGLPGA